MFIATARQSWM